MGIYVVWVMFPAAFSLFSIKHHLVIEFAKNKLMLRKEEYN